VDIDVLEGHIAHELQTHHNHPGHPEEQNIEAGDQRRGRIIGFEFRCLIRPSQRRKGPEGRRKPGIEHIGIAQQLLTATGGTASRSCLRDDRLGALQYDGSIVHGDDLLCVAGEAVPGRNLMSPPDLAGDAPVFDVPHPAEIVVGPAFRNDPDFSGLDSFNRRLSQRLNLDEPLGRQIGFHHRFAAVAFSHCHLVVFGGLRLSDGPSRPEALSTCR